MKFLLFLLFLPIVSPKLSALKGVTECTVTAGTSVVDKGFNKYYGIPLGGDVKATFEEYGIIAKDDNAPVRLAFPATEKIDGVTMAPGLTPFLCYFTAADISGKVYFVKDDMDVYHFITSNYTVEITKDITTIFSNTDAGSTLGGFKTDNETAFQIYSGLLGESETLLYTFDSKNMLDTIFIQVSNFYIKNSGSKTLKFSVSNKGEDPLVKVFDSNGFITSPGFPNLPAGANEKYLNAKVNIAKGTVDRKIKISVSAIQSPVTAGINEIQLVDETSSVTVSVGDGEFPVQTKPNEVTTETFSVTFTTVMDSFTVKSVGSAYSVQFELEDIPSTSTVTTKKPESTVKPTLAPGGTCPPVTTCPVCPVVTCPTVTACSCSTSTTEVPTTTQGVSTSTVGSLLTIVSIYYIF